MVILSVGWSTRINRLARIAVLVYCAVLVIIPLSYLHVEDLLPITDLLTSQSPHQTDLIILIHEALFAHLCNTTDYLYGSVDRLFDQFIVQPSERHSPDLMALKKCLLLLSLLVYALYAVRRYSRKRGKTLPQTIFCYRLFDHSPPFLFSL